MSQEDKMMFSPTSYMKYAYLMLFLSVNNDTNAEASCPAASSLVVRMCQNGEVKNRRIYVDASSARNVSATECRCTILLHDGGQVVWVPLNKPGYDICDTSLQVDNTQQRLTIGCLGGSLIMDTLPLRSTINLTLHKPIELNNPNAADYCYRVSEKASNLTIKCCDPRDQICVINSGETDPTVKPVTTTKVTDKPVTTTKVTHKPVTTTKVTDKPVTTTTEKPKENIPEELPGNIATHKPSISTTDCITQLCGQETAKFPVEIVVPVIVVAILFCVATVIGAVNYVRRQRKPSRDQIYDRHAGTAVNDVHQYEDLSQPSDYVNTSQNL